MLVMEPRCQFQKIKVLVLICKNLILSHLLLPKLKDGLAAALAGAAAVGANWKPVDLVEVAGAEVVARVPNDATDVEVDSWKPPVAALLVAAAVASVEGLGELKLKLGTVATGFLDASELGAWLDATAKVGLGTTGEVEETTGAWIEVVTLVADDIEARGLLFAGSSCFFTSSTSGSGSW